MKFVDVERIDEERVKASVASILATGFGDRRQSGALAPFTALKLYDKMT